MFALKGLHMENPNLRIGRKESTQMPDGAERLILVVDDVHLPLPEYVYDNVFMRTRVHNTNTRTIKGDVSLRLSVTS